MSRGVRTCEGKEWRRPDDGRGPCDTSQRVHQSHTDRQRPQGPPRRPPLLSGTASNFSNEVDGRLKLHIIQRDIRK